MGGWFSSNDNKKVENNGANQVSIGHTVEVKNNDMLFMVGLIILILVVSAIARIIKSITKSIKKRYVRRDIERH